MLPNENFSQIETLFSLLSPLSTPKWLKNYDE